MTKEKRNALRAEGKADRRARKQAAVAELNQQQVATARRKFSSVTDLPPLPAKDVGVIVEPSLPIKTACNNKSWAINSDERVCREEPIAPLSSAVCEQASHAMAKTFISSEPAACSIGSYETAATAAETTNYAIHSTQVTLSNMMADESAARGGGCSTQDIPPTTPQQEADPDEVETRKMFAMFLATGSAARGGGPSKYTSISDEIVPTHATITPRTDLYTDCAPPCPRRRTRSAGDLPMAKADVIANCREHATSEIRSSTTAIVLMEAAASKHALDIMFGADSFKRLYLADVAMISQLAPSAVEYVVSTCTAADSAVDIDKLAAKRDLLALKIDMAPSIGATKLTSIMLLATQAASLAGQPSDFFVSGDKEAAELWEQAFFDVSATEFASPSDGPSWQEIAPTTPQNEAYPDANNTQDDTAAQLVAVEAAARFDIMNVQASSQAEPMPLPDQATDDLSERLIATESASPSDGPSWQEIAPTTPQNEAYPDANNTQDDTAAQLVAVEAAARFDIMNVQASSQAEPMPLPDQATDDLSERLIATESAQRSSPLSLLNTIGLSCIRTRLFCDNAPEAIHGMFVPRALAQTFNSRCSLALAPSCKPLTLDVAQ
ncbi:hypothetical protein BC831DRAFT_247595 [Entophlyctis helioformis]|nr:hypothetical protein BC831DRAFT_247595 [Entophlyctis helioformis]